MVKISEILEKDCFIKTETDGVLTGDVEQECSGIIITFMATFSVIENAIKKGCNLIISHEGIYYSHDNLKYEKHLQMVQQKKELLKEHGIVVYRHHDAIHRQSPDLITQGLVEQLDFEILETVIHQTYTLIKIKKTSFGNILKKVKVQMNNSNINYIGEMNQEINDVVVLVGYRGGNDVLLPIITKHRIDLVIYGEGPEWEFPYFLHDYNERECHQLNLIALGHEISEEFGMKKFSNVLQSQVPEVSIQYCKTNLKWEKL